MREEEIAEIARIVLDAIQRGVRDERELCAKIAEEDRVEFLDGDPGFLPRKLLYVSCERNCGRRIAEKIRRSSVKFEL